ncbi:MAG: carboxypeptidase regulatory-like domain-containing protein, partial [Candidatus Eremiobacteraeota bacterium]|nr:carboxypeptidase regulatory-like domain-containing protein [Candidatus Eremiobacteraeota bacterium]
MHTYRFPVLVCALVAGLTAATLAGCANPTAIGVQTYGTITGTVVDVRTQKPIANALTSVGSQIARYTQSDGSFILPLVPEGTQTVTVSAGGYSTATVNVMVTANQTSVVQQ